jgi:glycerate 2-kinase
MMKIICAPDSFKESLSAADAAAAMRRGILASHPGAVVDCCPIADGGEGTVEAMLVATKGSRCVTAVRGPLGETVQAAWGMLGERPGRPPTAVLEMAAASGLVLVPPARRDPTRTSTFGTGELIRAALDAGARQILIGIGGSATNDGGCGAAQALGVRFHDVAGRLIDQPITGGDLQRLGSIDASGLDSRLRAGVEIVVACDVRNPLTGPQGAAAIYGPQKGADAAMIRQLDAGLAHLAALFHSQLGKHIESTPGSGAAGGLGGGLLAIFNAELRPGVQLVLQAVQFDKRVRGCDWCFTGEGRLDGSSLSGKACMGVTAAAARHRVPTIALVGSAGSDAATAIERGLHSYHVIAPHLPASESMRRAAELLEARAAQVARTLTAD